MPGLVIDGGEYWVAGVNILNYRDHRELKLAPGEDMRARRTRWIRSIILHNTKNIETRVAPGQGPETHLEDRISRLWSTDNRAAGAHLCVDWDGTVACLADLAQDAAYHAGQVNEVSIGIEIYEDSSGLVYSGQLAIVAQLVRQLCRRFGIQMQMPPVDFNGTIPRLLAGGRDCVGVFGHCHAYAKKPHDPGSDVFKALRTAGFVERSFVPPPGVGSHSPDDKLFWYGIQKDLGLEQDGIPGPATCDALRAAGYGFGLWRPGGVGGGAQGVP